MGDLLDHGNEDAEAPVMGKMLRQPILLQAAERDGGGRIAGKDHQRAAQAKEAGDPFLGQLVNLFRGTLAVRRVAVIAQIDEALARQAMMQGIEDGKAAMAGIEDTYHRLCRSNFAILID
jgi:hypothetical protein